MNKVSLLVLSRALVSVTLKKKGSGTKGRESNCPKTSLREREKPTRARKTYATRSFLTLSLGITSVLSFRDPRKRRFPRVLGPNDFERNRRSAFDLVPRPFGRGRNAQTISRNARRAFSKNRARDRERSLSERNNRIHAELFSARAQFS